MPTRSSRRSRQDSPTTEGLSFAYCIAGADEFAPEAPLENRQVCLYAPGDHVRVRAGNEGLRFLLVSGRPLGEPIAWRGPIVMNTADELRTALREYEEGTFVKVGSLRQQ